MRGKRLVYALGGLALAAGAFFVLRGLREKAGSSQPEPVSEYINPAACAGCHGEIAKSYRETGMGRSFSRPKGSTLVEDYEVNNQLYHKPSERYYTMIRRGDRFYQRRHQIGGDGKETNVVEVEVDYILGSGNHARSYLHLTPEGKLVELPVGWYAEKSGFWGMNPGYDRPDHQGFRREVSYDCMFCHNGYPAVAAGQDGGGKESVYPENLPEGIDCQRCHGPGRKHAELAGTPGSAAEAIRAAILNPARLGRDRQMEVCMQCHLETTSRALPHAIRRYDRAVFSYRPTEPLADYVLNFDRPNADTGGGFEIAHAAYRLRQSACFRNSEMTCTTCHDPHRIPRGEEAVQHYVSVCRNCHAQAHAGVQARSGDCLGCHMPKRRTDDVVHVVMTDHYIQRQKPAGDLLAPLAEVHESEQSAYRGKVVHYYPEQGAPGSEDELYLAVAQVQNGADFESGIPRLEQALQAQPSARGEFCFELAEAYRKTGQQEKAIPWYREALRRSPEYRPALLHLALALSRTGHLAEAAEVLERTAKTLGPDAGVSNNLGEVYLLQGRVEEAERALRQALAVEPDLPEANNLLGTALSRKGDREGAEAAFRAALRAQPDFALAQNNLANLLARGGDLAQARYHFEKAIAMDPKFADAQYNYGVALAENGLFAEAQAKLEAAVRIKPDFAEAQLDLANLLASTGRVEGAIPHFQRAVELRPEMAEAHFNLGTALGSVGRRTEAVAQFQAALRLNPNYYEAHFNLAQTLAAEGDFAGAREHFQKAAQSPEPRLHQAALDAMGGQ